MGLFNNRKLIGTVKIKFYGEDKASVDFETSLTDSEIIENRKVELFAMYYAKILYNLVPVQNVGGKTTEQLIDTIQLVGESIITPKVVAKNKFGEKAIIRDQIKRQIIPSIPTLVTSNKDSSKTYKAELYEKDENLFIQTYTDEGGEGYYASNSVLIFLQYLINNLSDYPLVYLMLTILRMNTLYTMNINGSYENIENIIRIPAAGLDYSYKLLNDENESV